MCSGYGGGLASISNAKEMDFVRNLSSKLRSDPVWIGLAYQFQKRVYFWSNGSSFNSSVSGKWLGELAGNVSENKCVEILGNGSSLTDCCKENKYFICEKAKGELPRKKLYDSNARGTFYMYMRRGKENLWTGHHSEGYNPKRLTFELLSYLLHALSQLIKVNFLSLVQKHSQQLSRN